MILLFFSRLPVATGNEKETQTSLPLGWKEINLLNPKNAGFEKDEVFFNLAGNI